MRCGRRGDVGSMSYGVQRIAGLPGEIGVLGKYLNRVLHLVGDALAGRLESGPKLKIFESVIGLVAVLVVHAFKFCERAAQIVDHYHSMFEIAFSWTGVH